MATILLIDDDAEVRRTIGRMLLSAGYDVVEAADGKSGLNAIRIQAPDLVITDILMPGQEGIETIARIREFLDVPIIAISGTRVSDEFDPLRDATLLGAQLAIAKPFDAKELIAAVKHLLEPA